MSTVYECSDAFTVHQEPPLSIAVFKNVASFVPCCYLFIADIGLVLKIAQQAKTRALDQVSAGEHAILVEWFPVHQD
jgi:hypothetical protein